MCNLINTEDQCEWHRMTRMTGPDCAVMCNLINTYTHIHNTLFCFASLLLFLGVFLPVIYRRGVRYSRCPSLWLCTSFLI